MFHPGNVSASFSPDSCLRAAACASAWRKFPVFQHVAMACDAWHRTCESSRCVAVVARSGGAAHPLEGEQQCAFARVCRSEEHTSELQSLMRISYAVFCLKKKKHTTSTRITYKKL